MVFTCYNKVPDKSAKHTFVFIKKVQNWTVFLQINGYWIYNAHWSVMVMDLCDNLVHHKKHFHLIPTTITVLITRNVWNEKKTRKDISICDMTLLSRLMNRTSEFQRHDTSYCIFRYMYCISLLTIKVSPSSCSCTGASIQRKKLLFSWLHQYITYAIHFKTLVLSTLTNHTTSHKTLQNELMIQTVKLKQCLYHYTH